MRFPVVCWALSACGAFFATLAALATPARAELPQTTIGYRIDVNIDPASRRYGGREVLRWQNRAERPIDAVPMHLYLNAFANKSSTWMRESFLRGMDWDEFLTQYPDPWGWLEPTTIRQRTERGERTLAWHAIQPDDANALDRSLIEVRLAEPVGPDEWLVLDIEFAGRLPIPMARTGCVPDFCLVGQWFPKIGVLETPGVRGATEARWAARQFHGPTEFYADFAQYDVTIDAPAGWLVRATGKSIPAEGAPPSGMQRVRHAQDAVHDFAIVLGSDLVETVVPHRPKGGGREVEVRYLLPHAAMDTKTLPARAQRAVEGALDVLGSDVGPYPYDVLTVITPPYRARRTGGMEYPTLITGFTGDSMWEGFPLGGLTAWEGVLVHEFGHQYWYGLLATNEQEEAFLDEGFNSYWDTVGMPRMFGSSTSGGTLLGRSLSAEERRGYGLAQNRDAIIEPIRRQPSALFFPSSHGLQIYGRPAVTFRTAVGYFGEERVHHVFAAYYARHRFSHPDVEDFLEVARETGGGELEAFLREAFSQPRLPDYEVVELRSQPASTPLGRYLHDDGSPVVVTEATRGEHRELVLDDHARDADGKVWLLVTDPGFVENYRSRNGTTRWVGLEPTRSGQDGDAYFTSEVRLRGPGWRHLPVDVELTFSDGAVVHDVWDGRATWRAYYTVRRGRLVQVRIDPDQKVAVDVFPINDGMRLESDRRLTSDWSSWLGAVAQWLGGGLSLWL